MQNLLMNVVVMVGALALSIPFAAPVAVADDETAQTKDAASPEKQAKPDKPKMICKKEAMAGSAIPRRVCRSPHQIQAEQAAAKENMNRVNDGQTGRTAGGPG